jgi:DNA repair exonuclease SbcCD nuclease subunit
LHFGHIHKPLYNLENNIIYPGSIISFGFDELGEHGILDVELNKKINNNYLEKNNIKINFIKLDNRIFEELFLNISEINSLENLIEKINNLKLEENKLFKIILIGNKKFEININKIINLIYLKNILKIKDNTKINIDISKILEENNLKGIFLKEVLKLKEGSEYNDETIQKAIEIGLENI